MINDRIEDRWNIKPRLLWCPKCKKDYISTAPSPKCPDDNETLITVQYSVIDKSRLAGIKSIFPPVLLPGVK